MSKKVSSNSNSNSKQTDKNLDFTDKMRKKLKTMLQKMQRFQSNFTNLFKSFDSLNSNINNASILNVNWRAKKIEFFDFHLFVNFEADLMIREKKNVYYQNVNLFI